MVGKPAAPKTKAAPAPPPAPAPPALPREGRKPRASALASLESTRKLAKSGELGGVLDGEKDSEAYVSADAALDASQAVIVVNLDSDAEPAPAAPRKRKPAGSTAPAVAPPAAAAASAALAAPPAAKKKPGRRGVYDDYPVLRLVVITALEFACANVDDNRVPLTPQSGATQANWIKLGAWARRCARQLNMVKAAVDSVEDDDKAAVITLLRGAWVPASGDKTSSEYATRLYAQWVALGKPDVTPEEELRAALQPAAIKERHNITARKELFEKMDPVESVLIGRHSAVEKLMSQAEGQHDMQGAPPPRPPKGAPKPSPKPAGHPYVVPGLPPGETGDGDEEPEGDRRRGPLQLASGNSVGKTGASAQIAVSSSKLVETVLGLMGARGSPSASGLGGLSEPRASEVRLEQELRHTDLQSSTLLSVSAAWDAVSHSRA